MPAGGRQAGGGKPARMSDTDHRRLREAVRRGDENALTIVIERHWIPVVRFVRSVLGDADLAEDIAQETFVRFWTARERWRGEGPLEPLLLRIARNAALDERKRKRFVRPLGDAPDPPAPIHQQPDASTELGELERAIQRAIAALPPKRREIFLLARASELTYAQIAEALGVSTQTVANQMSRALRDLRAALRSDLE